VTSDNVPSALMDIPEVRDAHIRLRIAELRVLAAQTAIEFWRGQPQPSLRVLLRSAMRRANGQRHE
jgi:hypothetical protein